MWTMCSTITGGMTHTYKQTDTPFALIVILPSGRLVEIYNRLKEIDAWGAEARAVAVLSGLGFSHEQRLMQTKDLSGGWRMR